jgi:hypothetical protein
MVRPCSGPASKGSWQGTRSSGDVGSMSGLPESGRPCAILRCRRSATSRHMRCRKNRYSITSSARASSGSGMVRPSVLAILRLMTSSTFAQSLPERSKSPRTPKPQHPLSAMSYCHMSFDWCSEAIANAVGGKCISYVGGNLCLCLLIQASNCCCDRGC